MPQVFDLKGQRFGRWSVCERAAGNGSGACWVCVCDCGARRVVAAKSLREGRSQSCGCEKAAKMTVHGLSQAGSLYNIWDNMVARCTKPQNPAYPNYGGRGITVCDRWLGPSGVKNFMEDVGPRPPGLTLDRKDNNRGYSPDNVRWATYSEQNRNKRNSKATA